MRKPRTIAERWTRILAWLKKEFPPNYPVTVRSIKMKDQGGTELVRKKFLITVRCDTCWQVRFDSLLHEWAHALTWEGAETFIDDHSAEWGIAYARVYREFYRWKWGTAVE